MAVSFGLGAGCSDHGRPCSMFGCGFNKQTNKTVVKQTNKTIVKQTNKTVVKQTKKIIVIINVNLVKQTRPSSNKQTMTIVIINININININVVARR
ncbi:uncharacterized protein EKO05_0009268 [Ascochyta rabiei]|uniref:uncharacterized protein n=1 Tax=Didymella rabiei TaxID=5454 RepID=UPI0021FF14C1|nr:uncharacterized protein EKO05_0009268 [Ascochyta rabiei]UPX18990.1 hypothetical protein EKO05_0009268 [Ascochyta rabiei]